MGYPENLRFRDTPLLIITGEAARNSSDPRASIRQLRLDMGRHVRREHLHYFLANPNQYHPCGENSTEPSQTTDRQVAHVGPNNLLVTHRLPIRNNTMTAIPAEGSLSPALCFVNSIPIGGRLFVFRPPLNG